MIDLKMYLNMSVLIQLKQPYTLQLGRIDGGKIVPAAVVVDEGRMRFATPEDAEAQPLMTGTLVGTIVERRGAYVLQYKDQTNPSASVKIETELSPELIMSISVPSEDRILL